MQITVTDVATPIPATAPALYPGGPNKVIGKMTIQNVGAAPCDFAARSNVTYGGANGGLRLAPGAPGGNATQSVETGVWAICATGLSTTIAYEYL